MTRKKQLTEQLISVLNELFDLEGASTSGNRLFTGTGNDPVMVMPASERDKLPELRCHYEHRMAKEREKLAMREAIAKQLNSDKDRDNDPDQDD